MAQDKKALKRSIIGWTFDLIFVVTVFSLFIYCNTNNYRIPNFVFPVMTGGYILTKTLMKVIFKYKDKSRKQNDDPVK